MYITLLSILITLILLLSIYLIIQVGDNNNCHKKHIYQYITYDNIESNIKSGDLLLFSNLNFNFIPRVFGHPSFSHTGLVVKKNNQLYSLEMVKQDWVYPKQTYMKNIIMIPLKDRIKNYSGYVYHTSLLKPLTIQQENELYNYSQKNYKFIQLKDFYQIFRIFNRNSNIKMCSQFTANILEDFNILPKTNPYIFWNYHKKIIDLCDGKTYSQPIQIIPNELLINNILERKVLNYC